MPQHDFHHGAVRRALEADGWTVTHDPYTLAIGNQNVFVDLGAERMLAATRGSERIAVEVKSFLGRSSVADLEQALGQYLLYRVLLTRQEYDVHLLVVDIDNVRIERWRK